MQMKKKNKIVTVNEEDLSPKKLDECQSEVPQSLHRQQTLARSEAHACPGFG
jgi:hypothetical protein